MMFTLSPLLWTDEFQLMCASCKRWITVTELMVPPWEEMQVKLYNQTQVWRLVESSDLFNFVQCQDCFFPTDKIKGSWLSFVEAQALTCTHAQGRLWPPLEVDDAPDRVYYLDDWQRRPSVPGCHQSSFGRPQRRNRFMKRRGGSRS